VIGAICGQAQSVLALGGGQRTPLREHVPEEEVDNLFALSGFPSPEGAVQLSLGNGEVSLREVASSDGQVASRIEPLQEPPVELSLGQGTLSYGSRHEDIASYGPSTVIETR